MLEATKTLETESKQVVNWTSYVPEPEGEISQENHHTIAWDSKESFLAKYENAVGFVLRTAKATGNPFLMIENDLQQTAEGLYINYSKEVRASKDYTNIDIQTRVGMDKEGTINTYFYAVRKGEQKEVTRFK